MRYILGVDLHNVVSFKKLSVDFDQNLTYVRGLNLDADPASPTGNGAGKTLMFSSLVNLFYQSTPLALKKKSKRDILRNKGSSIGAIYKASEDGATHEIIQTSSKYSVFEDGKDVELRTIPIAEEYIRTLFPLSETKLYTTVYLSTERPYLLQRDTDSNRLQHISDIFNLDMYDGIKEALSRKLRSIKDNELKLSVLEQHQLGLKKKLSALSSETGESEYLRAKEQYEKIASELASMQEATFSLTTRLRDLTSLLTIEQTLDKLRKEYTFKQKPNAMKGVLKEQRTHAAKWDSWTSNTEHAQKSHDRLQAKIDALDLPESDHKELSESCSSLAEKLASYDADILELTKSQKLFDSVTAEISELEVEYNEIGITNIPNRDYASEIALLKSTIKLEKLLQHDHEDSSAKCPTCLSDLDFEAIRATVDSATKKLAKSKRYARAAELRDSIKRLKKSLPDLDPKTLKTLKAKRCSVQQQFDDTSASLEVLVEHNRLVKQLGEIEFPAKPTCAKPTLSQQDIDDGLELCNNILDALSSKDLLLSNHEDLADLKSAKAVATTIDDVEKSLAAQEAKSKKLKSAQSTFAETVTSYEQYKNTGKVYKRELKEIEEKIAKLSPGMADKKILEILMKAYGTKGLRSTAAESVCQLLQTNLNHYRDLIFAEAFSFEVKASDTGVSILVDRNNGKPDSVSDVRNLSGAESNSFQLLCLMSLLPLMPDNDRVNICILDEPTSHMDAVSRSIFNERYVPVLREIVPSVYIISPHLDDVSPNSCEWLVQKKNGVSTLVTQHG